MAFNKSSFTKTSTSAAVKSAVENKVSSSTGSNSHRWYKATEGLKYFVKPKEPGKMVVNILPFNKKDGAVDWVYSRWVHMIPKQEGFGTNDYICNGHDACCRQKDQIESFNKQNGIERTPWDDIKAYVAKQRAIYLMNPVGTDEVYIYECNAKGSSTVKSFPEKLNGQAVACSGDDQIIDYASPDAGKSVVLVWGEASFNGHKFTEITGIAFTDRKEEISDEVWNKIPDHIEMIDNIGPNDDSDMEKLLGGESLSEDQKQEEFEKSCEETQKPSAMDAFKVKEEPADDMQLDFSRDPYTKPAPVENPAPQMGLVCPNGFDIKTEYGCHRQCMRCPMADKCEKIAG